MATSFTPDDRRLMRGALALARRGLGRVWPNPAVGCVIVKDGAVAGRGWTQPGGRPHAETEALKRAASASRGATVYVTLEPCSHRGQTPPCADALIAAEVARVVAAVEDPDPRVSGEGLAALRRAGIAVDAGLCAEEAREVNLGFFTRVALGRPMATLKLATSLDGRIAAPGGDSKWITSPEARQRAHLMRAMHDAVMIGIETALADDPLLTCRLPGMEDRKPVRVVMDSQARLPLAGNLARSAAAHPVWVVASGQADIHRAAALERAGVKLLRVVPGPDHRPDPARAFAMLGAQGLTRVLVEGGGRLAASLLKAGLIDRLVWFRAPIVLGGDGVPAVADLDIGAMAQAFGFQRRAAAAVGPDLMESYVRSG
ncbi:MAG: bifunctional diaminohydroxyphosphoribosylaminopyrimidine deaminase/5-amino-6-(5-phosphoribosylamino)uracil reductase RibD [Rhodospirillales bacterium]